MIDDSQTSSSRTGPSRAGSPSSSLLHQQQQEVSPQEQLLQTKIPLSPSPSLSFSSDCKMKEEKSPSMNPCAASFTPKPTYADRLKASLPPRPRATHGKTPGAPLPSNNKHAESLPRSHSKDVGSKGGSSHGTVTKTDEDGGKPRDQPHVSTAEGKTPKPEIRISHENGTGSRSLRPYPYLRHLYDEQQYRYEKASNFWTCTRS